jgi:hypothetical protein
VAVRRRKPLVLGRPLGLPLDASAWSRNPLTKSWRRCGFITAAVPAAQAYPLPHGGLAPFSFRTEVYRVQKSAKPISSLPS